MDLVMTPGLDPAHDVLHYGRQALDAIFAPKSVAVIGATETPGSVGRTIVWNLISSTFGGTIYPVNPKRPSILGIKAIHARRPKLTPISVTHVEQARKINGRRLLEKAPLPTGSIVFRKQQPRKTENYGKLAVPREIPNEPELNNQEN